MTQEWWSGVTREEQKMSERLKSSSDVQLEPFRIMRPLMRPGERMSD